MRRGEEEEEGRREQGKEGGREREREREGGKEGGREGGREERELIEEGKGQRCYDHHCPATIILLVVFPLEGMLTHT